MSEKLLHAKVGGPPVDWPDLHIFDMDTGLEITKVCEVSVKEPFGTGWLVRYANNSDGNMYLDESGHELAKERLTGRYEIRRL